MIYLHTFMSYEVCNLDYAIGRSGVDLDISSGYWGSGRLSTQQKIIEGLGSEIFWGSYSAHAQLLFRRGGEGKAEDMAVRELKFCMFSDYPNFAFGGVS